MTKMISSLFLLLILSCNNGKEDSKDKENTTDTASTVSEKDTPGSEVDSATMMKALMTYMTPGKFHNMLQSFNGRWSAEMTLWETPKAVPKKSTLGVDFKMALGGRFQEGKLKGTFMGMPFESNSLLGYDNAKNKFVCSITDNMATGILYMEGQWNEETRTINFTGSGTDPLTGKAIKIRENYRFIDDKNQLLETYMTINGTEFKSTEIKFTRS